MSIRLMSAVDHSSLQRNQRTMARAYADIAGDDGDGIFASTAYMAWKTGYSIRQVQRLTFELIRQGILVVVAKGGDGPGDTNRYSFCQANLPEGMSFRNWLVHTGLKDDKMSPFQQGQASENKGDKMSPDPLVSKELFITVDSKESTAPVPEAPDKSKWYDEKGKPTSKHPAIACIQAATHRFPRKTTWPQLAEKLGENPDFDVFNHIHQVWCSYGNKPTNIWDQFRWYFDLLNFDGPRDQWTPPRPPWLEEEQSSTDGWVAL